MSLYYQWRQWQTWFVGRLQPRWYNNTPWTHAANRAAVFCRIYCKCVTYIVEQFGHDWVAGYTQSFCYSSLSLCSLSWLPRNGKSMGFDHICVCIRWPQVSQHLPSFITLAVTGWHGNGYNIKHSTSQPRRMVMWREADIHPTERVTTQLHNPFISQTSAPSEARQQLVFVGILYAAWNRSEPFLQAASVCFHRYIGSWGVMRRQEGAVCTVWQSSSADVTCQQIRGSWGLRLHSFVRRVIRTSML
jgi:hypothetical protein